MTFTPVAEMTQNAVAAEVASTVNRLCLEIERLRTVAPPETPESLRKRKVNPGKFNDAYYRSDYDYTLNRMTDMVLSVRHNLDLLRVYDKNLLSQPDVDRADAVTRTANALNNAFGSDIVDIFTAGHIDRLITHETAMKNADTVFNTGSYRPILNFIIALKCAAVVGDKEASDYINANLYAIGAIMLERKIDDYREVLELVTAMDNGSAPLLNGAL